MYMILAVVMYMILAVVGNVICSIYTVLACPVTYFLRAQSSLSRCTDTTSLARLGTYSLEWTYLSNITGDTRYYNTVGCSMC